MTEATSEVATPNAQKLDFEIKEKQKAIDEKNEEINKLMKDLEKLQQENQKNTKELLDEFLLKIGEYKKEIEKLQAEITRLQASLKEASSTMRNGADQIDAVLASSVSPETKKDEKSDTPVQSSPNTASQNDSQSTASTPNTQTTSQTPQQASSSTQTAPEISSQEASKTEKNSKPGAAFQTSTENVKNNAQEQVPQIAPVAQSENPQASDTQRQTPQAPEASTPAPQAESQQTPQKIETQPELTEDQKLTQVRQIFDNLSVKFANLQAESNSITLTASELASLDQASNLLQQAPISQSTADQRALFINDEDALDDYIDDRKAKIKQERKKTKKLREAAELEEELAKVRNHNNYNLMKINSLAGINQLLQTGQYLDAKLQIPREQKFALELIKKRDLLRS